MDRANKEFAEFLILDWISELKTEQQISLEFLDQDERRSVFKSFMTANVASSDREDSDENRQTLVN